MGLIRHMVGPFGIFLAFIVLTGLGVATSGAGWIALSMLCAWPLLWAVSAWQLKGIKDNYVLTPKAAKRRGEVLN